MKIIVKLKDIANGISTKPNHTSWCWKGQMSILAFIILQIVYFLRLFSLLQICKYIYRQNEKSKNTFSIDKSSKRINVPPLLVEFYFITWCILLFIFPQEWYVTKYGAYYFFVESILWLLYYFFFRRFFAEKYSLMHTLEYIVILPLLIICQAQCISIIKNQDFTIALYSMFFPSQENSTYIIILGVIYAALIFGIFLSNMPIESVKEEKFFHYNFSIIGNGKIVQKLKNAIGELKPSKRVAVFDLETNLKEDDFCKPNIGCATFHYYPISDDFLKNTYTSNILWIATPPFAHLNYLSRFINNTFIVIEKPLVTNIAELSIILQLKKKNLWDKVFCLGYYYLEKAMN